MSRIIPPSVCSPLNLLPHSIWRNLHQFTPTCVINHALASSKKKKMFPCRQLTGPSKMCPVSSAKILASPGPPTTLTTTSSRQVIRWQTQNSTKEARIMSRRYPPKNEPTKRTISGDGESVTNNDGYPASDTANSKQKQSGVSFRSTG
jgi:hypothetical protein